MNGNVKIQFCRYFKAVIATKLQFTEKIAKRRTSHILNRNKLIKYRRQSEARVWIANILRVKIILRGKNIWQQCQKNVWQQCQKNVWQRCQVF